MEDTSGKPTHDCHAGSPEAPVSDAFYQPESYSTPSLHSTGSPGEVTEVLSSVHSPTSGCINQRETPIAVSSAITHHPITGSDIYVTDAQELQLPQWQYIRDPTMVEQLNLTSEIDENDSICLKDNYFSSAHDDTWSGASVKECAFDSDCKAAIDAVFSEDVHAWELRSAAQSTEGFQENPPSPSTLFYARIAELDSGPCVDVTQAGAAVAEISTSGSDGTAISTSGFHGDPDDWNNTAIPWFPAQTDVAMDMEEESNCSGDPSRRFIAWVETL